MPVRKNMKNNLIPSSPMKVVHLHQEEEAQMKQGIVTILGSDSCHGNKPGGASIRRTLSADMSSKKWLQQNGFYSPAVKKIPSSSSSSPPSPPSSSSSSSSSSSESEEEYEEITAPGQDDVWRAIQAKKERDDEEMEKKKKPLQMDVWGTMLTHKSENSAALLAAAAAAPLPPPYVHPLVKRSASTLSEKSLEICTESLGSETGSDCFSAETEDQEKVVVMLPVVVGDSNDQFADTHVAKYKKSPTRPFPPPLPSIAGGDGAALHVQSHRENGRLVLEAVSLPQRNHFHAQRCDGRLVLTLAHAPPACELTLEEVFDNMEDVDEDVVTAAEEEEEKVDDGGGNEGYVAAEENFFQAQSPRKEKEYMVEQNLSLPSGIMSLNKSRMVIKKLMAVGNMNPKWSQNLNKSDQVAVAVAEEVFPIPQSLPPPPRVARMIPSPAVAAAPAAASFNAYEYFWRNKTAVYGTHLKNKNADGGAEAAYENKDLVVVKGKKTEYSVPYLRGCKEARRSLSIWEPYCIATS